MTAPYPEWPRDFIDLFHTDHDDPMTLEPWPEWGDQYKTDHMLPLVGWMIECRCGATYYVDITLYRNRKTS